MSTDAPHLLANKHVEIRTQSDIEQEEVTGARPGLKLMLVIRTLLPGTAYQVSNCAFAGRSKTPITNRIPTVHKVGEPRTDICLLICQLCRVVQKVPGGTLLQVYLRG